LIDDKWSQVRQRLEAEEEETVVEIRRMQEMLRSDLEPDLEDGDPNLYEREKTLALLRNLEEKQYFLSRALARVDDGTYGRCELCGNDITAERLEALPYAAHCRGCKELMEKGIVVAPAAELVR
jgi:RNA polymerase-binding transcription factor DksA